MSIVQHLMSHRDEEAGSQDKPVQVWPPWSHPFEPIQTACHTTFILNAYRVKAQHLPYTYWTLNHLVES